MATAFPARKASIPERRIGSRVFRGGRAIHRANIRSSRAASKWATRSASAMSSSKPFCICETRVSNSPLNNSKKGNQPASTKAGKVFWWATAA
ncbi:hypothetical protein D3C85_1372790 [compost metagenome]